MLGVFWRATWRIVFRFDILYLCLYLCILCFTLLCFTATCCIVLMFSMQTVSSSVGTYSSSLCPLCVLLLWFGILYFVFVFSKLWTGLDPPPRHLNGLLITLFWSLRLLTMMMRGWRACYKFLGGPICSFYLFLYFCICIFVFVFVFFVFPCIRGWVVGGGGDANFWVGPSVHASVWIIWDSLGSAWLAHDEDDWAYNDVAIWHPKIRFK